MTNLTKEKFEYIYDKNPHFNRFYTVIERLIEYGIKNRFKTPNTDFKTLEL